MKTDAYWEKRFRMMEEAQHRRTRQYYHDETERAFRRAQMEIQRDIAMWYQRFADNNEISLADAKSLLHSRDLEELRWTVEEYIARGKTYGMSEKWRKALENASAKIHVSWLEALQLQMQQHIEELYGNYTDSLDSHLRETYTEGFYRAGYELEKGTGIGAMLPAIDAHRLNLILANPWVGDGKIFSDRIWKDKNRLGEALKRELSTALIRGEKYRDAVNRISKEFQTSKNNAARLVSNEAAAFALQGQQDAFRALDVEKLKFVATLDEITCPVCGPLDGKVIALKDRKSGVNAPLMHIRCRCVMAPYFDDDAPKRRAMRNPETDKSERVPGDMTYSEWKKIYIDKTKTFDEWEKEKGYTSSWKNDILHSKGGGLVSDMIHNENAIAADNGIKNKYRINYSLINSKAYHDKFGLYSKSSGNDKIGNR